MNDFPGLLDALSLAGISWDGLTSAASEVVLYGSRAQDPDLSRSDWDLFCVGRGRSRKRWPVDILWVRPEALGSPKWLGSELAGHLAAFGVWLHGEGNWIDDVFRSPDALNKKERLIRARLAAFEMNWGSLLESYRQKYFALIRRDLQRYEILEKGFPIPPSSVLDEHWLAVQNKEDVLVRLVNKAGGSSSFFMDRLSGFAESFYRR